MRLLKTVFIILSLICSFSVMAQDGPEIKVPLTKPGENGTLHLGVLNGSIKVKGYSGSKVVIKVKTNSLEKRSNDLKAKDGLRRITTNSAGFTAEEYNNLVVVKPSWSNSITNFEVQVPRNFSLKLSTVNDGNIYVENVSGEFEITNTNGSITMEKIRGSVIADAINDHIIVRFDEVTPDVPMAFSSLNGDVDITFPSNISANISAKTENGDVLTDFELDMMNKEPKFTFSKRSGFYQLQSDKGVYGNINEGGAKYSFKTLNGDILIRKGK